MRIPLPSPWALLAPAMAIGPILLLPSTARADVTSWVSTSAGGGWVSDAEDEQVFPALRFDAGLGSPPSRRFFAGGGFQLATQFGYGTDLALAARLGTGSYARGAWGLALDLGAFHRLSAATDGAAGALTLGAPWGVIGGANGTLSADGTQTLGLFLGFDFARLTAHRTSGQRWWPNPLAERAADRSDPRSGR